ncbi:hypothetical protein MOU_20353 [Xanthomonas citri pv. malvacearum str. GSPB1386]|nr:hypothetical protein BGK55_22010 [Xanthomonas citri pv. malvacearum]ASY91191.1 hypothetical protein CIW72_23090 [Xanthomonas citri pv. malvacearum]EKQ59338.1 hypothetical protein MOU_20353 [Xanthomonas citri pv. malvacearum str. GSPB1386]
MDGVYLAILMVEMLPWPRPDRTCQFPWPIAFAHLEPSLARLVVVGRVIDQALLHLDQPADPAIQRRRLRFRRWLACRISHNG